MRELPPAHFTQKDAGAVAGRKDPAVLRHRLHGRPNLTWGQLPEVQPRREHRCAVHAGDISPVGVRLHRIRHKELQPLGRAGLAGRPGLAEPRVPLDPRQQRELGEIQGRRPPLRRRHLDRRRETRGRLHRQLQAMAPERREDLERFALLVGDGVGLVQQRRVETFRLHALRRPPGLQTGVACDHRGLVATVPEDRRGAGRATQSVEFRAAFASRKDQPRTPGTQIGVERGQRVMQPPSRRPAGRPTAIARVIEDVDRNDRLAACKRSHEGGIILQTQVLTEPEKSGRHAVRRKATPLVRAATPARRKALLNLAEVLPRRQSGRGAGNHETRERNEAEPIGPRKTRGSHGTD